MTKEEFQFLPNRKLKFITYTGRVLVGGNVVEYNNNGEMECYILTQFQNVNGLTKDEKIKKGILIPIKPEVIEEAKIIQ